MTDRWIVVTGGAGFVGSRLIRALNASGHDRIVLVDSFTRRPEKLARLGHLRVADFVESGKDVKPWDSLESEKPATKTAA